jgi:hypothetical protein
MEVSKGERWGNLGDPGSVDTIDTEREKRPM